MGSRLRGGGRGSGPGPAEDPEQGQQAAEGRSHNENVDPMVRRDHTLNELGLPAAFLAVDLDHHSPKTGLGYVHQGGVFAWSRGDLSPGARRDRGRPAFERRCGEEDFRIVDDRTGGIRDSDFNEQFAQPWRNRRGQSPDPIGTRRCILEADLSASRSRRLGPSGGLRREEKDRYEKG